MQGAWVVTMRPWDRYRGRPMDWRCIEPKQYITAVSETIGRLPFIVTT
jgi:hypothetical protein